MKAQALINAQNAVMLQEEKVGYIYILPTLKDKSRVDKIIVKKQPYQLLNISSEFFPSFDASNFHESS